MSIPNNDNDYDFLLNIDDYKSEPEESFELVACDLVRQVVGSPSLVLENASAAKRACNAVHALGRGDAVKVVIVHTKGGTDVKKQLMKAGAGDVAIEAIRKYIDDPAVVLEGFEALGTLASRSGNRIRKLAGAGAIEVVITAMEKHSRGSCAVAYAGLWVIGHLADDLDTCAALVKADACELIINEVMGKHRDDEAVVLASCRAISNMARHDDNKISDRLENAQAYDALLTALRDFPNNKVVMQLSFGAIAHMVRFSEGVGNGELTCKLLIDLNAQPLLEAAAGRGVAPAEEVLNRFRLRAAKGALQEVVALSSQGPTDFYERRMYFPPDKIGVIIGRDGAVINAIKQLTGC